jgi:hypothetical protein
MPNQHRTDEELTTYSRTISLENSFAAKTQRWLEGRPFIKRTILVVVLVGTCMVIGDGILTPAISGNALYMNHLHVPIYLLSFFKCKLFCYFLNKTFIN